MTGFIKQSGQNRKSYAVHEEFLINNRSSNFFLLTNKKKAAQPNFSESDINFIKNDCIFGNTGLEEQNRIFELILISLLVANFRLANFTEIF